MNDITIAILVIVGTLLAYIIARRIYQRFPSPLLLPLVGATAIIVIILLIFQIPYETFMIGGDWINKFLGPAVVALALPLYQHRDTLVKLAIPLIVGSFIGAVVGVLTGVYMTKWVGFDDEILYSILPKSVTTPVAMDISQSLGGIGSLAALFVMIAGISGAMLSTYMYNIFRLTHPAGRGVALGAASHAIGTSKALENSELEGSISTIAMILSAVFVSIITPIVVQFLL